MAATRTLRRVVTPVIPALVVLGFFVWFSNWIPQTRWEPPRARTISAQMTPADLARVGAVLVRERGCLTCHTLEPGAGVKGQGRGPNFVGIAARRATGVPGGPSDLVAYLTQSLYDPGAYLVEGYANIMPASHRPPAKLGYEETTAVVDYLMSLGGTPAVKVGDLSRPPTETARVPSAAPATAATTVTDATAILEKHNCLGCHALKAGEDRPGPPFVLASLRESAALRGVSLDAYLIESIIQPRVFVRGNFPLDLMPDDYGAQLTAGELHAIISYLSAPEHKQ
ncbi:MAG: c-type cytochrome [Thermomicrobiales bacterium]|nr:c-type cytochrome [Thermomicrobiales bacterium]